MPVRPTVVDRRTTLYAVAGPQGEALQVLIEHPRMPGWELVKPKGEVETTETEAADAPDAPIEGSGRPALGFMPGYDDTVLGVLVEMLVEGGPAQKAGLADGDVIIRVGDREVDSVGSYMTVLSDLMVGQKVEVVVMRGDERKTFEVVVGQRSQ